LNVRVLIQGAMFSCQKVFLVRRAWLIVRAFWRQVRDGDNKTVVAMVQQAGENR